MRPLLLQLAQICSDFAVAGLTREYLGIQGKVGGKWNDNAAPANNEPSSWCYLVSSVPRRSRRHRTRVCTTLT